MYNLKKRMLDYLSKFYFMEVYKMNCKNKLFMTKRKAFTLIELLIVIAIIGILFIVLVSKVDFATDKAKATGVQTDFRSFQMAFDTVAKENAGFNTFGWDTGDTKRADFATALAGYTYTNEATDKADGKRNSYDEGDKNLNGTCDTGETFTGRKVYTEVWSGQYTMIKPGTDTYDRAALSALETAINANLDPKLQITINSDGGIVMANGAQDPWSREYHGQYYSAEDGMDRGAIFMFSDGPNNAYGSDYTLANGVATVFVPNSNKNGKDDYSLVSIYSYLNGYGEALTATTGFSNNQMLANGNVSTQTPDIDGDEVTNTVPAKKASLNDYTWSEIKAIAQMHLGASALSTEYNINLGDTKVDDACTYYLVDIDGNSYDGFVFAYDAGQMRINDSMSNDGGYGNSEIHQTLSNTYQSMANEDLKNSIKSVSIEYNKPFDENLHYINATLFIPSRNEWGYFDMSYFSDETKVFDASLTDIMFPRHRSEYSDGEHFYVWSRTCSGNDMTFDAPIINLGYTGLCVANSQFYTFVCFVIG